MSNRGGNVDMAMTLGPSLNDNSSGRIPSGVDIRSKGRYHSGGHGMIGIIGRERAKTYTPSDYGSGDQGGAAGGYGLQHGIGPQPGFQRKVEEGTERDGARQSSVPPPPMLIVEGGVRGGGVSHQETVPHLNPLTSKSGYDEHARGMVPMGAHGCAGSGVEGMPKSSGGAGLAGSPTKTHGMREEEDEEPEEDEDSVEDEEEEESEEDELGMAGKGGHSCGVHGCGFKARSDHGLTRHMQRKHTMGQIRHSLAMAQSSGGAGSSAATGSAGGMGSSGGTSSSIGSGSTTTHAFGGDPRHGCGYDKKQVTGESEGLDDMRKIQRSYDQAARSIGAGPVGRSPSSYGGGDSG